MFATEAMHVPNLHAQEEAVGPYQLIEINAPADLDQLETLLPEHFDPAQVILHLRDGLDPCCKRILIEQLYNDKDYRSTFYNFYAKKGYRYEAQCARLHFFDDRVVLGEGLELLSKNGNVGEGYFGYMVLRPTRVHTIGRTVISPRLIRDFHGCVIDGKHKVHVLGTRLSISGFPYMSQHADISVCAHAACWAILRHYSERYSKYAEHLTFDITRMAHEFDPGGLLPSKGLHLGHAERVFASAGTFPVIVAKDAQDPGLFYRQLFAYIESAFPLFAAMYSVEHAIAVIGHGALASDFQTKAPAHFASEALTELVVVDDNHLPYKRIGKQRVGQQYGVEDIDAFIVPLPDKVYYSAEAVDGMAIAIANYPLLGFDHSALGEPVVRYFLTTSAKYREFMHSNRSQFDPELVSIAMQLSLPQFVWIIEVCSKQQWADHHVETRVILDATASPTETAPIFLMHNSALAYVCDRGGVQDQWHVTLQSPGSAPLSRMPGNLSHH